MHYLFFLSYYFLIWSDCDSRNQVKTLFCCWETKKSSTTARRKFREREGKKVFREVGNIFQNLVGFTDDHVNIVIIITKVSWKRFLFNLMKNVAVNRRGRSTSCDTWLSPATPRPPTPDPPTPENLPTAVWVPHEPAGHCAPRRHFQAVNPPSRLSHYD